VIKKATFMFGSAGCSWVLHHTCQQRRWLDKRNPIRVALQSCTMVRALELRNHTMAALAFS
jgi:hypothetical protein